MGIDEIYVNLHKTGIESIVALTNIKTEKQKQMFKERGIMAGYTVSEFKEKYPDINEKYIYFGNIFFPFNYWDNERNILFNIPGMGDDGEYLPLNEDYTLQQEIQNKIESIEKNYKNHNYKIIFDILTNTIAMQLFNIMVEKGTIQKKYIYKTFLYGYIMNDYGIQSLSRDTVNKIIESKTTKQITSTKKMIEKLPENITIYRGAADESTDLECAISWTTDINVANLFAARRGSSGIIYKTNITKNDVFEYIDDRGESEVLVLPKNIDNVEKIELYQINEINDIIIDIIPMYHSYTKMLDKIDFVRKDTELHGKEHCARVLFYSLIISKLKNVNDVDMQRLATAAIYHDCRRDNDGDDLAHGKYAAEYYRNNRRNADDIIQFIIEYHSRPDNEGLNEIKTNPKFKNVKGKVKLLYSIFKDADALDRIRYGIRDIDLNQIRLDISKRMTAVARDTFNNLKLSTTRH